MIKHTFTYIQEAWNIIVTNQKTLIPYFALLIALEIITGFFIDFGNDALQSNAIVIYMLLSSIFSAMYIYALHHKHVSIQHTFKSIYKKIPYILLTVFLAVISIFIGLFLFVIPGIYIACAWAIVIPILVLEHTSPFQSFKESRIRMFGYKKYIFVALSLYSILSVVIALISLAFPVTLVTSLIYSLSFFVLNIFFESVTYILYLKTLKQSTHTI